MGKSLAASTKILTSAALLICVGVLLFWYVGGYRYDSSVVRIIESPQSYDGEIIDNLVALGPDASPGIGRALLGGVEFPYVLVLALGELGDQRGAAPLLEFLSSFAPYSNRDDEVLPIGAIEALRDIGDPVACEPLASIYPEDVNVPRIRLAAAASVARICPDAVQADAEDFVMARYQEMKADPWAFPIYWDDLVYKALIDVNSDKGNAIWS